MRSRACGSPASATADWLRWRASTAPRSSAAYAVTNSTGRPRRARATATLAALPPAYSTEVPSARRTMSTSDSPTTSTSVMALPCRKPRPRVHTVRHDDRPRGTARTASRREQSLVVLVLVAVATVAACLVFDRLVRTSTWCRQLAPHWPHSLDTALGSSSSWHRTRCSPRSSRSGVSTRAHRCAGAVCALLAGVSSWGIQYGYQKLLLRARPRDPDQPEGLRLDDDPARSPPCWRWPGAWPDVPDAPGCSGSRSAPALAWVQRSCSSTPRSGRSGEFRHGELVVAPPGVHRAGGRRRRGLLADRAGSRPDTRRNRVVRLSGC